MRVTFHSVSERIKCLVSGCSLILIFYFDCLSFIVCVQPQQQQVPLFRCPVLEWMSDPFISCCEKLGTSTTRGPVGVLLTEDRLWSLATFWRLHLSVWLLIIWSGMSPFAFPVNQEFLPLGQLWPQGSCCGDGLHAFACTSVCSAACVECVYIDLTWFVESASSPRQPVGPPLCMPPHSSERCWAVPLWSVL